MMSKRETALLFIYLQLHIIHTSLCVYVCVCVCVRVCWICMSIYVCVSQRNPVGMGEEAEKEIYHLRTLSFVSKAKIFLLSKVLGNIDKRLILLMKLVESLPLDSKI